MEINETIIKRWINAKFNSFTKRTGDTPTDALQLVNKKYVDGKAGAPGGADTQVQFNDGGSAFGGDTDLTWNKTTNTLFFGDPADVNLSIHTGSTFSNILTSTPAASAGTALHIRTGAGSPGDGGLLEITSGNGNTDSNGGPITVTSGNGAGTGGGGTTTVKAGNGGATGNGGDVILTPGNKGASGGTPGNVLANDTTLATTVNGGFLVIPKCAGAPTGTPTSNGSMIYDTTNNKLYVYNSAWKSVTLT